MSGHFLGDPVEFKESQRFKNAPRNLKHFFFQVRHILFEIEICRIKFCMLLSPKNYLNKLDIIHNIYLYPSIDFFLAHEILNNFCDITACREMSVWNVNCIVRSGERSSRWTGATLELFSLFGLCCQSITETIWLN